MKYEWDEEKRTENIKKHGVDFVDAVDFVWDTALIGVDKRQDYGEQRYKSLGFIDDRLYCLVYTLRSTVVRIISLRKANKRERSVYEKIIQG
ncbi:MAG: BrnT family toxin [Nitrospirae bacterium]|nr:BrnT family toxin [Nitrospirota bacterium]